jgi:hypothetical protein
VSHFTNRRGRAFGRWYFRKLLLKNRCLCPLRLRPLKNLCMWIESRYVFPTGERHRRLYSDIAKPY